VDTAPAAVGIGVEPADARRLKWEAKQLDAARPLGAWELYRALNDALDDGRDQFDLSNRDVRLALILMGGLNAALVVFASQSNLRSLSTLQQQIEFGVMALYALFAIVFLLQAIDTLRPASHYHPNFDRWPETRADHPAGVRYFEDVVTRTTEAHWQAWKELPLERLNAELAVQLHSLCRKNQARKVALRRLFYSLRIMTIVFSAIVLLFAVFTLA
jgi:hypothetical protein